MNELESVGQIGNEEPEVETTSGSEEIDISLGSNEVIADIPSEIYGAFIKILQFLSQGMSSQDIFFIKDGKLNSKKTVGFIYSDMSELFANNNIEIVDPSNAVKLLSLLKGGENVVFVKEGEQYIIATMDNNEPIRSVVLPIPEVQAQDVITKPEIGDLVKSFDIPVDRIEDAINASKVTDSSYFIVSLDSDHNIISIETQDGKYKDIFMKGTVDKQYKLFDLTLVSKPDNFKFEIHKNEDDVWFKMISDIGLVNIEYLEKVDTLNEFDAFAL